MLRITTEDSAESAGIKLEGKLAGAWVHEVEIAWRAMKEKNAQKPITIDLFDVTFIDAEGKKLLKRMSKEGADFRCCGPDISATIAEILKR